MISVSGSQRKSCRTLSKQRRVVRIPPGQFSDWALMLPRRGPTLFSGTRFKRQSFYLALGEPSVALQMRQIEVSTQYQSMGELAFINVTG